jgi:malonyl-CoA O-methyltransferase
MDMERIELTFETPERLLQELRELGRNLHTQRFEGLRGRGWLSQLHQALQTSAQSDSGLKLTFEIVYGHAFKPKPRIRMSPQTEVPVQDLKSMLRRNKVTPLKP